MSLRAAFSFTRVDIFNACAGTGASLNDLHDLVDVIIDRFEEHHRVARSTAAAFKSRACSLTPSSAQIGPSPLVTVPAFPCSPRPWILPLPPPIDHVVYCRALSLQNASTPR
ncbi:hypothetical protein D9619_008965 [Psilocybe cf. subviscida]|uniref:Uncharacterized protein n=1 Tax=Psilocybe cf. subviscida TaxID=2480587 RepID=A0A8H5BUA6_9AGAR|nr:hypothetical protein D9619_008965 [Psilocybe cf. subviscida]